jgi:hypothetical protein
MGTAEGRNRAWSSHLLLVNAELARVQAGSNLRLHENLIPRQKGSS